MGWRKVVLSAEERVSGVGQNLTIDFELAFIAAGVPEAAALFVESAEGGDFYYFSPEATRIFGSELDAVRAGSCQPPVGSHVVVAVGHRKAAELLRTS
jgi:hypothetical protein